MSLQITEVVWPHRLTVRTLPFQGSDTGSNPVGVTSKASASAEVFLWFCAAQGVSGEMARRMDRDVGVRVPLPARPKAPGAALWLARSR